MTMPHRSEHEIHGLGEALKACVIADDQDEGSKAMIDLFIQFVYETHRIANALGQIAYCAEIAYRAENRS